MSNIQDFSFKKNERLKQRKNIDTLFQNGEAFSFFPFRVVHHCIPHSALSSLPLQVGISVPKKKIKSAVKRNIIKRRTKEAWRLQKAVLTQHSAPFTIQIFLIYQSPEIFDFAKIKMAIQKILNQLQKLYVATLP